MLSNKEAIERLNEHITTFQHLIHPTSIEALNLAIKALELVNDSQDLVNDLVNERPKGKWIPVSERLPEKSGDYLVSPSDGVLEDYSDFSEVMIMPYDADGEAFGWWTDKYDPVSLGYLDSDFEEFEVIAWQPLPEPYKEADNDKTN